MSLICGTANTQHAQLRDSETGVTGRRRGVLKLHMPKSDQAEVMSEYSSDGVTLKMLCI